jgi:hypothetical protein
VKTAVSIPDPVFKAAEKAARRLRVSRSHLYARAIAQLLQSLDDRAVTESLDRVYGGHPNDLDPVLATLQSRALKEKW